LVWGEVSSASGSDKSFSGSSHLWPQSNCV